MTGYGSGRRTGEGARCSVEIQSVNRKQTEVFVTLPKNLASLEPRIREIAVKRVARGRLALTVLYKTESAAVDGAPGLDAALARSYYDAMRALQAELGAPGEVTIESVLRAPGVLRSAEEPEADPEVAWAAIEPALAEALDALVAMRAREGTHLAADIAARLETIRASAAVIRGRQPDATAAYRRSLLERIERADLSAPIDEERLAREVALFAERSDFSEELTRLESHLDQFAALLAKAEPVGRPMDFLTQEMARELNTLGAKANDLAISQAGLTCKAELDKIREQVQNIE